MSHRRKRFEEKNACELGTVFKPTNVFVTVVQHGAVENCISYRFLHFILHSLCVFRLSESESLINSHIYIPQCVTSELLLPGLCNCGEDNSCGRLITGNPTPAALVDTPYTFLCANASSRYVN